MTYKYPGQGKKCCDGQCGDQCTCCPFGCSFSLPITTSILGVCFTWACFLSCHFFQSEYDFLEYDSDGRFKGDFGVGPWLVQDFEFDSFNGGIEKKTECVGWADHQVLDTGDLDGALRFARGVIMPIAFLGLALFLVFVCGACLPINKGCLNFLSVAFLVFGTLMILSLVALASDWCQDAEDCTLQFGGIAAIFSFILWTVAGISICFMRDPTTGVDDLRDSQGMEMSTIQQPAPTESVVEQTLVEADGTVVRMTTKTITAPDGTKTVTETREIVHQGDGKGATFASASVVGGGGGDYPSAKAVSY